MKQPGLDNRHRCKNGTIGWKHGNTLIGTMRQTYCASFAPGLPDHVKLSDEELDGPSLSRFVRDHGA